MTNEEAIKKLKSFCHNCSKYPQCVNTDRECFEAIEMAIRALKNEQTDEDLVKGNTNLVKEDVENADTKGISGETVSQSLVKDGDLISRQAVIDIVKFECGEWKGLAKTIVKGIEQLPSAEKTAEEPIKHFGAIECPNCGRLLMLEEQTYSWCKGCKEYDTEKHCCHRYSSFIRESLQDSINAVLEDIKTEIKQKLQEPNYQHEDEDWRCGLIMTEEIIDKHISGKEQ